MKIIRVFPRRTKATPVDGMAFVGEPPLSEFRPPADEVHVSVTFTWDLKGAEELARSWGRFYQKVRVGGPALGDAGGEFVPGLYLRPGYTITSRGCPNVCPFCLVPQRETRCEIDPVPVGHIVQDNNLLACSDEHIERVLAMLSAQRKGAVFAGGLQADLFTTERAQQIYSDAPVSELWFAYDAESAWGRTEDALRRAIYWFGNGWNMPQEKVRCYVLAGFDGDTPEAAAARCEQVLRVGAIPFIMPWQPPDRYIRYQGDWKPVIYTWSRVPAMKAIARKLRFT